jgi:putative protease
MAAKKVAKKKVKKAVKKAKKAPKKKMVKRAVKKHVKKIIKKKAVKAVEKKAKPEHRVEEKKVPMKEVGKIAHFFDGISVAVVEVTGKIKLGDKIKIKGTTTDFEQSADSMQVDRRSIMEAKPGDRIGLKVREKVHDNDKVYVMD